MAEVIKTGRGSFAVIRDVKSYPRVGKEQVFTPVKGSKRDAFVKAGKIDKEEMRHVNV